MRTFNNFTKTGIIDTLRVIGEPASIGGNQFSAAFELSGMDVARHVFGDDDTVTTKAVCLKSALTKEPRINQTLTRVDERKTYVITEVESDLNTYNISLRAKDA